MAKRGNQGKRVAMTGAGHQRGMLARFMAAVTRSLVHDRSVEDMMGFRPFYKHGRRNAPRSKYSPHQGHQEKARRVRQGLAGLNCGGDNQ